MTIPAVVTRAQLITIHRTIEWAQITRWYSSQNFPRLHLSWPIGLLPLGRARRQADSYLRSLASSGKAFQTQREEAPWDPWALDNESPGCECACARGTETETGGQKERLFNSFLFSPPPSEREADAQDYNCGTVCISQPLAPGRDHVTPASRTGACRKPCIKDEGATN